MRESSSCPDPEVLAAFVDGRLSGEARRRVVEHLDACEECYAVFSETVRFQGEEEPRGRVVRTARFGARRWHWPAAAAAALVILAVLVAVPVLRMESERPVVATLPEGREAVLESVELVAAMELREGAAVEAALWEGWLDEGGLGFAGLSPESAAFRTGVRLVDLRVAVEAADPDAARTALAGLARVLEAAGATGALEDSLEATREAAGEARPGALDEAVLELEEGAVELLDPFSLAFGKWAEAGRLAAAAGDGAFFLSEPFTAFREAIPEEQLPETVAERVAEIRARTSGDLRPPGPAELEELRTLFGNLVALY